MTLNARLTRLEQMHSPADAYTHMSFEEIAAVITDLDREIEASVGMSIAEYADTLEEKITSGTLDMDEALARRFINSARTPNPEIARGLHQQNSTYPSFLKGCLSETREAGPW